MNIRVHNSFLLHNSFPFRTNNAQEEKSAPMQGRRNVFASTAAYGPAPIKLSPMPGMDEPVELDALDRRRALDESFYDSSGYDNQFNKSDETLLKDAALHMLYYAGGEIGFDSEQELLQSAMRNNYAADLSDGFKIVHLEDQYKGIIEAVSQGFLKGVFSEAEIRASIETAFDPHREAALGISVKNELQPCHTKSALFIDSQIENAAAYYAFYAAKAQEWYSGEDYDKAITFIDDIFEKAIDQRISEFLGNAEFLQADTEGISDSIRTLFDERKAFYSDILQADPTFSLGVEGTDNEWAASSSYYTAAKLRQHVDANASETVQSQAKYTAADLKAFAIFNNQQSLPNVYGESEELQGLYLGIYGITMEMLIRDGGMSEAGKSMLHNSYDILIDKHVEKANEFIQRQIKDALQSVLGRYNPIHKSSLCSAINQVINSTNHQSLEQGLRVAVEALTNSFSVKRQAQLEQGALQARYANGILPTLYMVSDKARLGSINALANYLGKSQYNIKFDLLEKVDIEA